MNDTHRSRPPFEPFSIFLVCLVIALSPSWRACFAQAGRAEPFRQRDEMMERELRRVLDADRVLGRETFFDYGGIFRFTLSTFDSFDGAETLNRTYRDFDVRPWVSVNIGDAHSFYGRLRFDVIDFNSGQSPAGTDEVSGPYVDQLFYTVDLDKLLERRYATSLPGPVRLTLGRQFFNVGQGFVYSQVDDGLLLNAAMGPWDLSAFGSRTIGRESNIDGSVNVSGNERYFYGGELSYAGIVGHRQYAYFVGQEDKSGGATPVLFADGTPVKQRFDYDSQYVGVGFSGQLARNLGYRAEGMYEFGRSHPDRSAGQRSKALNTSDRERIRAYAFDIGLDWYMDAESRPRVSLDYGLATGDEQRGSVTDTIGGNRPGSHDRNFLYFGFMDTGFNSALRFSNLRFVRLDGSFRPFHDVPLLTNMETGLTYYYYQKDERSGGISDTQSNRAHRTVGQEFDLYANWKLFSDLSFSFRYGLFLPGSAYSEKSSRHYYLGSLTYSF